MHISKLASRNAGMIYNIDGLVSNNVLKTVYNSFVQPHLNYCSSVWGLGSKSSINKCKNFTAQKKAVRAIDINFNNYFYNNETGELPCHTKEIFARNNLLTIHNLIAKNCLVSMHKIYLNVTQCKISNLFDCVRDVDRNSRRDPQFFNIPRSRLVALDKTLPYKGPRLYNHVVNSLIKNETSKKPESVFLNPFKKMVSSYLNSIQANGGIEWETGNFPLYEIL